MSKFYFLGGPWDGQKRQAPHHYSAGDPVPPKYVHAMEIVDPEPVHDLTFLHQVPPYEQTCRKVVYERHLLRGRWMHLVPWSDQFIYVLKGLSWGLG